MRRALNAELGVLILILAAQAFLLSRTLHNATNYDEAVYLAAVDALRHGQALGSDVFAAQFPGFYDLLRAISYVAGLSVTGIRTGLLAVTLLGTVGGWLVGRRFAGPGGGLLVAALLVIAPPLDLFGSQVIADMPALALTSLALGLAALGVPAAAVASGVMFGAALSVKLTAVTAAPLLVWLLRRRVPLAAAGAATVWLVLLLAHVHALGDLWASGVTYHEHARATPPVIPHPRRAIFSQIPRTTPFFVLAVSAAAVGVLRVRRVWPLWSWVVLAIAFLLWHGPLHYNHLVLFPYALAVAVGVTLAVVAPRPAWAILGVAVVAGYAQQLHRVDAARTPEPASNVAAARALAYLTSPGALVVDDRPIIAFRAHRRVVGSVIDLAKLRFETGSLTDADVIAALGRADAVVVSRSLRGRPAVLQAVRRRFALRYDRGGVRIYLKRPRT